MNVKEDAVGATLNNSGSAGQSNPNADWLSHADYTFLMNCDLIESCRSVNGEMSWDNGDLEPFQVNESSVRSTTFSNINMNESVAVGCQTEAEIPIPGKTSFPFNSIFT